MLLEMSLAVFSGWMVGKGAAAARGSRRERWGAGTRRSMQGTGLITPALGMVRRLPGHLQAELAYQHPRIPGCRR